MRKRTAKKGFGQNIQQNGSTDCEREEFGIAVVLHEGSTLLVVANALRLLRYAPEN